ncbi:unnamed protein product, partial [Polarella glacialis]
RLPAVAAAALLVHGGSWIWELQPACWSDIFSVAASPRLRDRRVSPTLDGDWVRYRWTSPRAKSSIHRRAADKSLAEIADEVEMLLDQLKMEGPSSSSPQRDASELGAPRQSPSPAWPGLSAASQAPAGRLQVLEAEVLGPSAVPHTTPAQAAARPSSSGYGSAAHSGPAAWTAEQQDFGLKGQELQEMLQHQEQERQRLLQQQRVQQQELEELRRQQMQVQQQQQQQEQQRRQQQQQEEQQWLQQQQQEEQQGRQQQQQAEQRKLQDMLQREDQEKQQLLQQQRSQQQELEELRRQQTELQQLQQQQAQQRQHQQQEEEQQWLKQQEQQRQQQQHEEEQQWLRQQQQQLEEQQQRQELERQKFSAGQAAGETTSVQQQLSDRSGEESSLRVALLHTGVRPAPEYGGDMYVASIRQLDTLFDAKLEKASRAHQAGMQALQRYVVQLEGDLDIKEDEVSAVDTQLKEERQRRFEAEEKAQEALSQLSAGGEASPAAIAAAEAEAQELREELMSAREGAEAARIQLVQEAERAEAAEAKLRALVERIRGVSAKR